MLHLVLVRRARISPGRKNLVAHLDILSMYRRGQHQLGYVIIRLRSKDLSESAFALVPGGVAASQACGRRVQLNGEWLTSLRLFGQSAPNLQGDLIREKIRSHYSIIEFSG